MRGDRRPALHSRARRRLVSGTGRRALPVVRLRRRREPARARGGAPRRRGAGTDGARVRAGGYALKGVGRLGEAIDLLEATAVRARDAGHRPIELRARRRAGSTRSSRGRRNVCGRGGGRFSTRPSSSLGRPTGCARESPALRATYVLLLDWRHAPRRRLRARGACGRRVSAPRAPRSDGCHGRATSPCAGTTTVREASTRVRAQPCRPPGQPSAAARTSSSTSDSSAR